MRYELLDTGNSLLNMSTESAISPDGLRTWPRVDERAILAYTRV